MGSRLAVSLPTGLSVSILSKLTLLSVNTATLGLGGPRLIVVGIRLVLHKLCIAESIVGVFCRQDNWVRAEDDLGSRVLNT